MNIVPIYFSATLNASQVPVLLSTNFKVILIRILSNIKSRGHYCCSRVTSVTACDYLSRSPHHGLPIPESGNLQSSIRKQATFCAASLVPIARVAALSRAQAFP
jgi:hypothetical protein